MSSSFSPIALPPPMAGQASDTERFVNPYRHNLESAQADRLAIEEEANPQASDALQVVVARALREGIVFPSYYDPSTGLREYAPLAVVVGPHDPERLPVVDQRVLGGLVALAFAVCCLWIGVSASFFIAAAVMSQKNEYRHDSVILAGAGVITILAPILLACYRR